MELRTKILGAAITSAILTGGFSANVLADSQINDWGLNLTNVIASQFGSVVNAGLNSLQFSGESYDQLTSLDPSTGAFSFTDTGVYNVTADQNGKALNLGFGLINGTTPQTGELTAVFKASGTGILGQSFTFSGSAGDSLAIYAQAYGIAEYGTTANNSFGAANGVLIAQFSELPGGGGSIQTNGLPTDNGQVTLQYRASYLAPGVWQDSRGNNLPATLTLGFITSNASVDSSNPINPMLVAGLGGASSNSLAIPDLHFYTQNGGQIKLELSTVPVPGAIWLFGTAFAGLIGFMRRKPK